MGQFEEPLNAYQRECVRNGPEERKIRNSSVPMKIRVISAFLLCCCRKAKLAFYNHQGTFISVQEITMITSHKGFVYESKNSVAST